MEKLEDLWLWSRKPRRLRLAILNSELIKTLARFLKDYGYYDEKTNSYNIKASD
jgi:hypothetical protein